MKSFIRVKIILLLFLFPVQGSKAEYQILRVIDGDSVEISAPFLPSPLKPVLSLRIYGVDTPEIHSPECPNELTKAQEAKEYTAKKILTARNKKVLVYQWDKYGGRVDGDIILDGQYLSKLLVDNGYARLYFGEGKESWCDLK